MENILLFLLFVIALITFSFIAKLKIKTYLNPLTFYLIFWIMWILISIINPFGLNQISSGTYMLLFLSIACFSIGFIVFVKPKQGDLYLKDRIELNNNVEKIIFIIQIIIMIVLILYFLKYSRLVSNLGAASARNIKFTLGYLFNSYLESILYNWVISCQIYIYGMLFIGKSLLNKKIDRNTIISIINIYIFSSIGGGRMILFDFLVFVTLILLYSRFNRKFKTALIAKVKLRYIIISFLFIYSLTSIYANRVGKVLNISNFKELFLKNIEQGIMYFIGPFYALNVFFTDKIYEPYIYTFGKSTFYGISEFFSNIFRLIGINFTSGSQIIGEITKEPISIGMNHQFNAFYTSLLNFYLDMGFFGIIIFSFLLGAFLAYAFNRYMEHKNIFNLLFLTYFTWIAISSSYRLPASFNVFLTLIILFFMNKIIKLKNINNFLR